jgi:hypothetical protein
VSEQTQFPLKQDVLVFAKRQSPVPLSILDIKKIVVWRQHRRALRKEIVMMQKVIAWVRLPLNKSDYEQHGK